MALMRKPPRRPNRPKVVNRQAKLRQQRVKQAAKVRQTRLRQQAATRAKQQAAVRAKSATAAKSAAATTKAVNAPQPANPYVEINANGQLDLPYSTQYGWDVLNKTEEMNQSLLDLQQQQQAQQLDYTQTKRDLGQQFEGVQRETLNNSAARGLARSSMYGKKVADYSTNYNNAVTDLESQNTQAQQGFSLGRTQIQNAFNNMLRQSGLLRAQEAAQNAGSLGYGKATPKTTARPKYKPKPQKISRPKPKPKKKANKKKGPGKKRANAKKKTPAKKKAKAAPKKKWSPIRRVAAKKVAVRRRAPVRRRRSSTGKRAI